MTNVVYSLPNPIELRQYLDVKQRFEQHLHRSIPVRIIYQGEDVLSVYEHNSDEYERLFKQCRTSLIPFSDDFYVCEVKRHFDVITRNGIRSLVFPFETMELHRNELGHYKNLILPDLPTIDKAKHNFLLRKYGFTELPHLLVRHFNVILTSSIRLICRWFLLMDQSSIIMIHMRERWKVFQRKIHHIFLKM